MSRHRKPDPSIPAFIDQRRLPPGCYWNRRDRYWYALPGGKRKRLCGPDAMLSDLHAAMEALAGVDRGSLDYMLGKFEASAEVGKLAPGTRADYHYCRLTLQRFKTKLRIPFSELRRSGITTPVVQRLVDRIAETHPTKANHVKRYLSAAYAWANRHWQPMVNPAKGVQQAQERAASHMPDGATMRAFVAFLRTHGSIPSRSKGSVTPYLWAVAVLAYECRMRSVEVRELVDADATEAGIVVRRHKGSLTNVTAWSPELHEAWDWLASRRNAIWLRRKRVVPLAPNRRSLVVTESGDALRRSTLLSAWRRAMKEAISAGVITAGQRFGMHGLKHRGITDTPGGREVRRDAAGHKTLAMTDRYSHDLDVYPPAGKVG